MLDAGRQARGVGQVVALEAPDHGGGEHPREQGILAQALGHPAPPGIPANVHHGGEGPVDAVGRGLEGGHPGPCPDQLRVPGGSLPERNREDGPEAVDHVAPHEERDPQPALFHGDALELRQRARIHLVQDGPHPPLADLQGQRLGDRPFGPGDLVQLADLLGQRHAGQELPDPGLQSPGLQGRIVTRVHGGGWMHEGPAHMAICR